MGKISIQSPKKGETFFAENIQKLSKTVFLPLKTSKKNPIFENSDKKTEIIEHFCSYNFHEKKYKKSIF